MTMPDEKVLDAGLPLAPSQPKLRRLQASQADVERGLARLVLGLVELLRQLMEREAIRQADQGLLDAEQEEALGTALWRLATRLEELKAVFGLEGDDLNLDLGPLGRLY